MLLNPNFLDRLSDTYEPITHHDPTAIGQVSSWLDDATLGRFPLPGSRGAESAEQTAPAAEATGAEEAPSAFWKLGWASRGQQIEEAITANMRGLKTGPNYPVIDFLEEDGTATSIKSIDLNATTYQDAGRLAYRINNYVAKLADFRGASYGETVITNEQITGRTLNIAVPKGSMTSVQKGVIDAAITRAKSVGIIVKITPF